MGRNKLWSIYSGPNSCGVSFSFGSKWQKEQKASWRLEYRRNKNDPFCSIPAKCDAVPLACQSLSGREQLTDQKTPAPTRSGSLPSVLVSHQLPILPPSHSHSLASQALFEEMGHFRDWFFLFFNTWDVTFARAQMDNLSFTVSVFLLFLLMCAYEIVFFVVFYLKKNRVFNISPLYSVMYITRHFFLSTQLMKTAAKDKLCMIIWNSTEQNPSHQSIKDITHTFHKLPMEKYICHDITRLVFCGNFHINYKAICMNYDLNKCPVSIKSPVLFKSSQLLDRFISYALHFLCQVFIKLIPIFKAAQAVSALKQYRSNTRSLKLLKPHGWHESDQRTVKDLQRGGFKASWIFIYFFFMMFGSQGCAVHCASRTHSCSKDVTKHNWSKCNYHTPCVGW